ncbi:NADPH:quinone reductase-like Zn-dependent oxidoreductase [Amycolatopsis bartoniae]|uniref:NADPH:quinone reductase n=1 Tax=Amycolatopsis bartoniae TaxID=941986 RepID=A0A8H9IXZ2_9PSEU|nr:NADP-dependent oxidoreductase [Amycolatopsis bartoniae]MBB2935466.1 NADPH:quinone reductase-like Zn-dependent oxidoreductase [Amycolatopsis bartoniae]TVT04479.1 NADP-dependent oxidoreductase [Amycolatopsis bartoniae]GHF76208.1 NADPH:quinone reductase [Amycolatopsis bartoniae]
MKALVATRYGEPEQLSFADLDLPRPGPGQIQVKIAAAAINPTDIRVITGAYRGTAELEFPYVPGNEFAGTVTEVGAGVTDYQVGDEVFGQALPRQLRLVVAARRPSLSTGALAEYAVFEASTPLLAHRPAAVPVEQAAALPIAGMTALGVMTLAAIRPGETAFVIGATGGVGTALVPLLAAAGARVVATGAATDHTVLRELGADEVLGYDAAGYPSGVDAVFDLVLPHDRLSAAAAALRPGGRLVTIIYPEPAKELLGRDDVDLRYFMDMDGEIGGMREVAEAAERGVLSVRIARRYRFEDAVEAAVTYAREHNLGKVVVTM